MPVYDETESLNSSYYRKFAADGTEEFNIQPKLLKNDITFHEEEEKVLKELKEKIEIFNKRLEGFNAYKKSGISNQRQILEDDRL